MEFSQLIKNRYSVRSYKPDAVEGEKLEKVLHAAVLAPTAANRQPFQVYVIETEKYRDQLRELYSRDWFVQAPFIIGIVADSKAAWTRKDGKNFANVDATIVFDHLILQAAELGLGTCWIAAFESDVARTLLDLPEGWEPLAFTPLGYPADRPREKKRKDMTELVVYLGN